MKETYGVLDKYFKALLTVVILLSLIVAFLVITRFVTACGGSSSSCAGVSHVQHQMDSHDAHEEHTEHSAAAAGENQELQDIKSQQIKALLNTPFFINDPGALLAQADILGLSEEQKAKLQTVQKEAADKAMTILTDKQRQQLGDVGKSVTPVQICKSVCPHKQEASADRHAHDEQTVCPVMGGAINKDVFTEYKGEKIYFCCPGCKPKFEKDPEKYVSKLPQFAK